jgi:tetratricopeptide (TPR) repeat protein
LGEAAVDYRAALQLDPLGYRPLRGAARLATRLNHSEALPLWEQVAASRRATAGDREEYAALLLQAGMFGPAANVIDQLLRSNPSTRALLLASDYADKNGNLARALEYARLANNRAPDNRSAQFRVADLLARSSKPDERKQARDILWKLAQSPSPFQRAAIEALSRAPELAADEQARLLGIIRSISPPTVKEDVLAAEVELRSHPENARAIYDAVVAKWKSDAGAQLFLAQWLNLRGEPERVLDLIPGDTANPQLLLARLDALAAEKRWSEIEATLSGPDLQFFDASVIESFRARVAEEQHATLDANLHWNKAIAAAGNDAKKLQFIADFAEQSGAAQAALQAYGQLARSPEHTLAALSGQQRLAAKMRDANAARNLAEKALALNPGDPDAQNREIYYDLLLGQETEANAEKARQLAARFPNRLEFRVTAALGCLRQHDAAGALAQFKGPPIEWSLAQPNWRAVYAAALLANDESTRANELIKTIAPDRLLPEEAALISVSKGD